MAKKIYWDKGHGGTDPGAVGNGLYEKDLNHKIVEYGMAYLNNNYTGHEQKTSRTGDQTLSLKQRTDDANKWGADLLLSCHINSSANKAANGFETFIYNINPGDATIALQNILHPEVYQAVKAFGINNDRGKKQGNLHMLRESKMTALLSETLFISNETDANRLKLEAFLKAVGEAHARGAAKFLGLPAKVVTASTTAYKESGVIRYIETGGYAGPALQEVHTYLFETGHNFDCKRAGKGSIVFLIGPFDTGMKNYNECKYYLDKAGHVNKLLTREEAVEWR